MASACLPASRLGAARLIAFIFVLTAALAGGPSHAKGTDQDEFLAAGAKKLSPKELKELFSGSRFFSREFTVCNFPDGSRVFKARGYSVQLRWWIDGRSRFCTNTRHGAELCDIEYFLNDGTLKIFNRFGDTVQEFSVKK